MSKIDDLMARIAKDVQIRKSRTGGLLIDSKAIRDKAAKKATESDPAMRALAKAANGKAKDFLTNPVDPYAGWTECAWVSLAQAQICRQCGQTSTHIAGEFLKLRGFHTRADGFPPVVTTVLVRRPAREANLPHEVNHLPDETVALCAHCTADSELYDKVFDTATKRIVHQMRLFS